METNIAAWKKGVKTGIPVAFGYFAVSFSFGILCKKAGLNPFEAVLMSATNLTSAGQFAGLSMITAMATLIEIVLAQLIINSRYFLMSFSLSQKIPTDTPIYHRLLLSYGITDEIFGVSIAQPGKLNPYFMYGVMTAAVPGWTLGTLFGVASGNIFPERITSALSIALYGMLLAVIIPPAKKNKAIAGMIVVSMLFSSLFAIIPVLKNISSAVKIIVLTVVIAGCAAFFFPLKEDEA
ncbi:AzlC family ABC transporter permease [Ureibacillus sp. FSL K6-8385]|uniref:AzlC family ABC transporter permease n=1 Tax=Ureibacillus terrenus TaxID=118246 RepID=A0A540V4A9_9BACL|nr:AzlC family ABC transporter permease [Ureibacillus terrenus]MED3763577.1 AzlC family ABC transporter permease [Ureibacillus terrenus]TQE91063.1 AzlC family ABC transporter permease [Ureibacillus terrenus]